MLIVPEPFVSLCGRQAGWPAVIAKRSGLPTPNLLPPQGSAAQSPERHSDLPETAEAPSDAFPKYPPHLVDALERRLQRLESRVADVERTLASAPQVLPPSCL